MQRPTRYEPPSTITDSPPTAGLDNGRARKRDRDREGEKDRGRITERERERERKTERERESNRQIYEAKRFAF